jgi:hypothetical protein
MDFHRKVFNKERVNDYLLTPNEQFCHSKKIGKPNNLKDVGNQKTKGQDIDTWHYKKSSWAYWSSTKRMSSSSHLMDRFDEIF